MTSNSNPHAADVVVTGLGMLTACGCGFASQALALGLAPAAESPAAAAPRTRRRRPEDYHLQGFNPLPHLSDKKMMKAISARDALGMVALENCRQAAAVKGGAYAPERTGLYVGAPPSACSDNNNYHEGIKAAVDVYGRLVEAKFGATFDSASPTTLLMGLPNNVLCYGAKLLDARGPNSNYTALEISGHMAAIGGLRALRLGKLDCALVGGYSGHTDPVFLASLARRGLLKTPPNDAHDPAATASYAIEPYAQEARVTAQGTVIAEGAAFLALERRAPAAARGAKVLCRLVAGTLAADGLGPYAARSADPALTGAMRRVLRDGGITAGDVGLVLLTASGIAAVDDAELQALRQVFGTTADTASKTLPAVATTARVWGNLMEAGGLGELATLAPLFAAGKAPSPMAFTPDSRLGVLGFGTVIDAAKPYALILRTSPWGEYSCLLAQVETAA